MGAVLEYLSKLKDTEGEGFSIRDWIINESKKAKNLSLASHVCKYSHPGAKTSQVVAVAERKNDGYLRSGNVSYRSENRLDLIRSAAFSPIGKFLLLVMEDGKTVIEHLLIDSEEIRRELSMLEENYEQTRSDFLAVKKKNQEPASDERVKQVYFPVDDKYHLLSLLTSSQIVSEAKARITEIRKKGWATRDKKNDQYGNSHEVIPDLSEIGFGGDNPQNISELITRNNGKAYLLSSSPPKLTWREVVRPRRNFFTNTLRGAWFGEDFRRMHFWLASQENNFVVRGKIKQTINAIFDHVMINVYKLREEEPGWSEPYSELPIVQKIWLDELYTDIREKQKDWLEEISLSFARWFMISYGKIMKNERIPLGDGELVFLRDCIETALLQDREKLA